MEATELEIEFLLNEVHDYETVRLVENETQSNTYQLQRRLALRECIQRGSWQEAKSILFELPHNEKDEERLAVQIARELVWFDGRSAATISFIEENISSPWALRCIGDSLLTYNKNDLEHSRTQLSFNIPYDLKYGRKIQDLLDLALQFENIVKYGKLGPKVKADVKSFVYCDIYLRLLHESKTVSCLKRLEALCANVRIVNEFGSELLGNNLGDLLNCCVKEDPMKTISLLHNNDSLSQSILRTIPWSPLKGDTHSLSEEDQFHFLSEYRHRKGLYLPETKSILQLGLVMHSITSPHLTAVSQIIDLSQDLTYQETNYDPSPWFKLKFEDPVWSVESSTDGRFLIVGTLPGDIYVYKKSSGGYKLAQSISGPQGAEQIKFQPFSDNFAVSYGGAVTGASYGGDVSEPYTTHEVTSPRSLNSYGYICWHPTRSECCFTVKDTENYLYMREFLSGAIEKCWQLPYTPSSISTSEKDIVILTAKITERPQHIITVNYETSLISDTILPVLDNDGMFTTLICSEWDPRTIMIVGPPNCIFIIDKYGKRPNRIIYGPKQKQCMLKAKFIGPMDKYIFATSEERSYPQAMILNRFTGEKVNSLYGHTKMVNDVAWAPLHEPYPLMFTASDDNTVISYKLQP